MKSEFCIIVVDVSLADKQVIIETNFRVDEKSLDTENVRFINAKTGLLEAYELKADGKKVIIQLFQEPKIGQKYLLQVSGIKDMLNRTINNPMTKELIFESSIKSKLKVLSPANSFAFRTNIVEIEIDVISEENESLDYCYEISSDVTFFNVVKTVTTPNKTLITSMNDDGQYYFRVRAVLQDDAEEFSAWTPVNTFVVLASAESKESNNSGFLEDVVEDMDFFFNETSKPKVIDKTLDGTLVRGWFSVMISENIKLEYLPEDVTEEGVVKIGEFVGYKEDL